MAFTVTTVEEMIRIRMKDPTPSGGSPSFLTDDVLQPLWSDLLLADEAAYALTLRSKRLYTYQLQPSAFWFGGRPAARPEIAIVLTDRTTPFTQEGALNYTISEVGLSVLADADATSAISLTGLLIDYRELRARVCELIADNFESDYAQSIGQVNYAPGDVAYRLRQTAAKIRGAFGC
jgi:hypothetical protein